MNELQITEDTIDHKWNRQHHGVIGRQIGRGECVEGIGHNGGARDDGDVLIEQWDGVTIQYLAVRASAALEQGHFSAAFAQPNVQREERGDHIEPR